MKDAIFLKKMDFILNKVEEDDDEYLNLSDENLTAS